MEVLMVGKALLNVGLALIAAAALKAAVDMLRADPFDPWSVVLAAGCILVSLGIGLTRIDPGKWIEDFTRRLGRQQSSQDR
jgi:hypothetical protein